MEIIQRVAKKHGLVALLHEKPFEGINGSGKHNNWSLSTDTGVNLLEPGDTPYENAQFLLFLAAVIKAVDEHQDLLRLSVATAGNDHRLGANEAPPAIISIFLGEELAEVIDALESESPYGGHDKELMKIGASVLPKFPKDSTDRNRTSPFAFTGNKFEFRMPGSNLSVSSPNIMLNAAVADVLEEFADALEGADDLYDAVHDLVKDTIHEHKRIIFNGNGYDDAWIEEAESRGLLNLKTTPDALPYSILDKNVELLERQHVLSRDETLSLPYSILDKNVELLERQHVLSRDETLSRYEIMMDEYVKTLNIEAQTMSDMAKKEILPAVSEFTGGLSETILAKTSVSDQIPVTYEAATLETASVLLAEAYQALEALDAAIAEMHAMEGFEEKAFYVRDALIPAMDALRAPCDKLETIVSDTVWPFPTYGKLLFGII